MLLVPPPVPLASITGIIVACFVMNAIDTQLDCSAATKSHLVVGNRNSFIQLVYYGCSRGSVLGFIAMGFTAVGFTAPASTALGFTTLGFTALGLTIGTPPVPPPSITGIIDAVVCFVMNAIDGAGMIV